MRFITFCNKYMAYGNKQKQRAMTIHTFASDMDKYPNDKSNGAKNLQNQAIRSL